MTIKDLRLLHRQTSPSASQNDQRERLVQTCHVLATPQRTATSSAVTAQSGCVQVVGGAKFLME